MQNYTHLWDRIGARAYLPWSPEFAGTLADGTSIAGSPDTVSRIICEQLAGTDFNYFVGQFVFGDLALEKALQSIELFSKHVMPAVREVCLTASTR